LTRGDEPHGRVNFPPLIEFHLSPPNSKAKRHGRNQTKAQVTFKRLRNETQGTYLNENETNGVIRRPSERNDNERYQNVFAWVAILTVAVIEKASSEVMSSEIGADKSRPARSSEGIALLTPPCDFAWASC